MSIDEPLPDREHDEGVGPVDDSQNAGDVLAGLSPRQELAISALLHEPTIARAAAAANVGERTLHKWLTQERFAEAYRRARRSVFEQAVSLTQRYASLAVQTLAKVMTDHSSPWNAKVAAATSMLRFAREAIELEDLAARLEAVERRVAEQKEEEPWRD